MDLKVLRDRIVRNPPPGHEEFAPSVLLLDLVSRLGVSQAEFLEALDTQFDKPISPETGTKWFRHNGPVGPAYRTGFFKLLKYACDPERFKPWRDAFEDCWAAKDRVVRFHDQHLKAHHAWIDARYRKNLPGETFALSELYVPLTLLPFGHSEGLAELDQIFSEADLETFARKGLRQAKVKVHRESDWAFIKGGPGSGKSALALTLAQRFTKRRNVAVLFLRGSHLAGEKRKLGEHDTGIVNDTIEIDDLIACCQKSSKSHLLLVIDGIDEFATDSAHAQQTVADTLNQIRLKCELLRGDGMTFKALVFGRNTVTDAVAKSFQARILPLEMGNLMGCHGPSRAMSYCYDEDLRPEWWRNYLLAKGCSNAAPVVNFMADPEHSMHELSREPLVLFLIMRTAWPDAETSATAARDAVNAYADFSNLNALYADIIDRIRRQDDWKEGSLAYLGPGEFTAVLRYMALACWHNGSFRSASVAGIRQSIDRPEIAQAFNTLLNTVGHATPEILVTAFYYRFERIKADQSRRFDTDEFMVEFTHRTFAEYLIATLVFDRFETALDAFLEFDRTCHAQGEELARALDGFIRTVMHGPPNFDLVDFLYNEAEIRLPQRDWATWRKTMELISVTESFSSFGDQSLSLFVPEPSVIERLDRARLFLIVIFGCLVRAHFGATQERTVYQDNVTGLESYDLSRLQTKYSTHAHEEGGPDEVIEPESLISVALSGVEWRLSSCPGLYLSGGGLEHSVFEECSFEGALWHNFQAKHLELRDSILNRARFETTSFDHTNFTGGYLRHSYLRDCFFQDSAIEGVYWEHSSFESVHFVDVTLQGVYFCRSSFNDCEFIDCTIEGCDFESALFTECEFKGCTFTENRTESSNFDDVPKKAKSQNSLNT